MLHKKYQRQVPMPLINSDIIIVRLIIYLSLHLLTLLAIADAAGAMEPADSSISSSILVEMFPSTSTTTTTTPRSKEDLTPNKLLSLAEALHKIVKRECAGVVNDLELKAYQAYLNRQILQGKIIQHPRYPLNFNIIHSLLMKCASHLSLPSENGNPSRSEPTKKMSYVDSRNGREGDDGKGKKHDLQSQQTIPPPDFISTKKPLTIYMATISNAMKPSNISKPSTPAIPHLSPTFAPKKIPRTTPNPQTPVTKSTDKSPLSVTTTTRNKIASSPKKKSWFSRLKHWLGRRKRDLANSNYNRSLVSESDNSLPFYTVIYVGGNRENEWDDRQNQWRSIPNGKGWRETLHHFQVMMTNMIMLAINQCPKEPSLDDYSKMSVVEGHVLYDVMLEELVSLENQGMYLNVNDHLEDTVGECFRITKLK